MNFLTFALVENIKFRKINNYFQRKLKDDIEFIKNMGKVFVKGDKATNIYKLSLIEYRKIMDKGITKFDKKILLLCSY